MPAHLQMVLRVSSWGTSTLRVEGSSGTHVRSWVIRGTSGGGCRCRQSTRCGTRTLSWGSSASAGPRSCTGQWAPARRCSSKRCMTLRELILSGIIILRHSYNLDTPGWNRFSSEKTSRRASFSATPSARTSSLLGSSTRFFSTRATSQSLATTCWGEVAASAQDPPTSAQKRAQIFAGGRRGAVQDSQKLYKTQLFVPTRQDKKMMLWLDDINLVLPDKYGSTVTIEALRQVRVYTTDCTLHA